MGSAMIHCAPMSCPPHSGSPSMRPNATFTTVDCPAASHKSPTLLNATLLLPYGEVHSKGSPICEGASFRRATCSPRDSDLTCSTQIEGKRPGAPPAFLMRSVGPNHPRPVLREMGLKVRTSATWSA